MKTRALREAAERARAAAFGPIPVRVHFPDGLILQAAFSALDPLSKLHVRGRQAPPHGVEGSPPSRRLPVMQLILCIHL